LIEIEKYPFVLIFVIGSGNLLYVCEPLSEKLTTMLIFLIYGCKFKNKLLQYEFF